MMNSSSFCGADISFLAFKIRMTGIFGGFHTFRCSFDGYFLFFFGGSVIVGGEEFAVRSARLAKYS